MPVDPNRKERRDKSPLNIWWSTDRGGPIGLPPPCTGFSQPREDIKWTRKMQEVNLSGRRVKLRVSNIRPESKKRKRKNRIRKTRFVIHEKANRNTHDAGWGYEVDTEGKRETERATIPRLNGGPRDDDRSTAQVSSSASSSSSASASSSSSSLVLGRLTGPPLPVLGFFAEFWALLVGGAFLLPAEPGRLA
jgi:hypothetical protein